MRGNSLQTFLSFGSSPTRGGRARAAGEGDGGAPTGRKRHNVKLTDLRTPCAPPSTQPSGLVHFPHRWGKCLVIVPLLAACSTPSQFNPKSHYPPDPWVKGYSDPDDCLGGEALAAREFALPKYPKRAFRAGAQGWVMLRLDVDAAGETQNVRVERAVPESGFWGGFEAVSVEAAENWSFQPPAAPMENCRVLLRYRFGKVSLGG